MSKRILAAMVAFVMIFSCLPVFQANAEEIAPNVSGTTYYVSSLHGAEGNDGLSESTPFASLLKINEITLQPGDLIFTGTPQGVMHGYPADQKNWLKPGDSVEVTIEGIGTLRNTFR